MAEGPGGIDPALLANIGDLDLVARIIVDGLVSGLHRSPFHGYSAEFSQYRHYRPGDDLKYLDWKLAARTDRLYSKQFRETTNMATMLVVDTSASMNFAGSGRTRPTHVGRVLSDPPGLTKGRYAVIAAAALAHVISHQGDAVGLVAANETFIPPRAGRQHLARVLASLGASRAGESARPNPTRPWQAPDMIRLATERMGRRGLLFVLSDFYDEEDRAFAELRRAARMGHEVVLLQIMSAAELDFPYKDDLEFVDLETGRAVTVNGSTARREYRDAFAAFLERWRQRAGSEGFQYSLIVTSTPPDRALRSVLLARRHA